MEWSLVDVVLVLHQQIGWMIAQIQSTVIVVLFCFFSREEESYRQVDWENGAQGVAKPHNVRGIKSSKRKRTIHDWNDSYVRKSNIL